MLLFFLIIVPVSASDAATHSAIGIPFVIAAVAAIAALIVALFCRQRFQKSHQCPIPISQPPEVVVNAADSSEEADGSVGSLKEVSCGAQPRMEANATMTAVELFRNNPEQFQPPPITSPTVKTVGSVTTAVQATPQHDSARSVTPRRPTKTKMPISDISKFEEKTDDNMEISGMKEMMEVNQVDSEYALREQTKTKTASKTKVTRPPPVSAETITVATQPSVPGSSSSMAEKEMPESKGFFSSEHVVDSKKTIGGKLPKTDLTQSNSK